MAVQDPGKERDTGKERLKLTEESQAATKASIIVVHGEVLDKIGFGVAERANRSAELRLAKTLHTLDIMATKDHARYRKEKYFLEDHLGKLKNYQLRLKREKLKKRLTADDLQTSAFQDDGQELLKPIDPDNMECVILPVTKLYEQSGSKDRKRVTSSVIPPDYTLLSARSHGRCMKMLPRGVANAKQAGCNTPRPKVRSYRELKQGLGDPLTSYGVEGNEKDDVFEPIFVKDDHFQLQLPKVMQTQFMTGGLTGDRARMRQTRNCASYQKGPPYFQASTRPTSSTTRELGTATGARRVPPQISIRSQSLGHISRLALPQHTPHAQNPQREAYGPRSTGSDVESTHSASSEAQVSEPESDESEDGLDSILEQADAASSSNSHSERDCVPAAKRVRRRGCWRPGGDWVPPEKEDMLRSLLAQKQFLQRRIDQFLDRNNP